jgi:protein gp37
MEIYLGRFGDCLPNVWEGTSIESRDVLDRLEHLRRTPAAVRFLSLEPLLEDIGELNLSGIGWVIVGGESGPGARPMHPGWALSIRDQCQSQGVPFFMKQMGSVWAREWARLGDRKAGNMDEWPEDLRIREMPSTYQAS